MSRSSIVAGIETSGRTNKIKAFTRKQLKRKREELEEQRAALRRFEDDYRDRSPRSSYRRAA